MVSRGQGIQGRQASVEERCIGEPSDTVRFKFCGSCEGDVLKSEINREYIKPRESDAG